MNQQRLSVGFVDELLGRIRVELMREEHDKNFIVVDFTQQYPSVGRGYVRHVFLEVHRYIPMPRWKKNVAKLLVLSIGIILGALSVTYIFLH